MAIQTKDGFKICSKCKAEKPFSEYWKCAGFSLGVYPSCKECVKAYKKKATPEQRKIWGRNAYLRNKEKIIKRTSAYAKAHPEIRRKVFLKYNYGISQEHLESLKNSQNGHCAICKTKPTNRGLFIDHCHSSGKIRGLLCSKCNSMIGFGNDNIEILKSAISYLEKELVYG